MNQHEPFGFFRKAHPKRGPATREAMQPVRSKMAVSSQEETERSKAFFIPFPQSFRIHPTDPLTRSQQVELPHKVSLGARVLGWYIGLSGNTASSECKSLMPFKMLQDMAVPVACRQEGLCSVGAAAACAVPEISGIPD